MAWYSMQGTALVRMLSVIFASLFLIFACVEASDLDHFVKQPSTAHINVAGVIRYRDVDGNIVLTRAAAILKERLSDSTPLQDAAMDLLHMCKSSKDTKDATAARQTKDKAKKIYAVRAAMVDISAASAVAPQSCSALLQTRQRFWQRTRSSLTDPINLPSNRELDACVKELFDIGNMWTSFISHGQDANTLCEVPGTDNAARMIVELLDTVNGVIPEWLNMFRSEQDAWKQELEERTVRLEENKKLEEQHKHDAQQEHEASKARLTELQRIAKSQVDRMDDHLQAKLADLTGRIDQLNTDIDFSATGHTTALQQHGSLVRSYAEVLTEGLRLQQDGLQEAGSAIAELISITENATDGMTARLEVYFAQVDVAAQDFHSQQSELLQWQNESVALQDIAIRKQRETLAFADQVQVKIADVSGQLTELRQIIEPVRNAVNAMKSIVRFMLLRIGTSMIGSLLLWKYSRLAWNPIFGFVVFWCIYTAANTLYDQIQYSWLRDLDLNLQDLSFPIVAALIPIVIALLGVMVLGFGVRTLHRYRQCRQKQAREVELRVPDIRHYTTSQAKLQEMRRFNRGQTVEPSTVRFC